MNHSIMSFGWIILFSLCQVSSVKQSPTESVVQAVHSLNALDYYKVRTTDLVSADFVVYTPKESAAKGKSTGGEKYAISTEYKDYINGKLVHAISYVSGKLDHETLITDKGAFMRRKDGQWKSLRSDFPLPDSSDSTSHPVKSDRTNDSIEPHQSDEISFVRNRELHGMKMSIYKKVNDSDSTMPTQLIWIGLKDGMIHRTEVYATGVTFVNDFYDFNVPVHEHVPVTNH